MTPLEKSLTEGRNFSNPFEVKSLKIIYYPARDITQIWGVLLHLKGNSTINIYLLFKKIIIRLSFRIIKPIIHIKVVLGNGNGQYFGFKF